jgi:hypothetical protein
MRRNRKRTWHPKAAQFRYLKHGKVLSEYPAQVFKAYYGLTGEPRKTLRQIAEQRGVSTGRIQQLRRDAERTLHREAALSRNMTREQYDRLWMRNYKRELRRQDFIASSMLAKRKGWAWKEAERQGWKLS